MIRPGYFCVAWEFQQNVRWGASIIRALAAKRLGVLAAQAMEIPWDSNGGILVKDIENMQKRFYKSFFLAVYRVPGHLMSCVGANKAGRSLPSRAGHSDGTRVKARSIRNSQTLGPFEGLWKGLKQGRMQTLRTGRNHKSNLLTRVSIEGQFQDPSKIIRCFAGFQPAAASIPAFDNSLHMARMGEGCSAKTYRKDVGGMCRWRPPTRTKRDHAISTFLKFDSECKECARIWLLEEAAQLDFRKIMWYHDVMMSVI